MDETELTPTPEELKAEQESTAEVKEEELRTKLADELGIDPEDESELLDKLVAKEKASREKLSGAIKQKIKYREAAKSTSQKPPKEGEHPKQKTTEELIDEKVKETLDARDIESLTIPDEIKGEIKELAKVRGISVRAAAELPYIKSRIAEAEKAAKIEEATPTRKSKGNYVKTDGSKPLNVSEFDLSTPEGRKGWEDAKAARAKYREEHP